MADRKSADEYDSTLPPRHSRQVRQPRLSSRAVTWLLGIGAALVIVVGAGVWLVSDALRARDALESARDELATLQDQVRDGDQHGADQSIAALQANARTADRATHGPIWTLVGQIPKVGPNIDALQTVSATVDGLAQHALPSLMDATRIVSPASLAPKDGRVDLDPLTKAAPKITGADQAMQAAVQQLAGISTAGLNATVADAVTRVRAGLDDAATTTSTAARAAQLLPEMLGADGTRNYLVLVQNNAEPRATGGIPGVVLHLQADDGKVTQVEERSGGSLVTPQPALPLHDDEQAIFSPLLGTDMRDVTFTPDFPRSGALAKAIWEQQVGGTIDGVISVDPGALALVLQATGPVRLADGSSLTAGNAVARLLNTVYLDIPDPKAQDAWFGAAAGEVFSAVTSGQGNTSAVLDQLAQAARDGRLMVWSAHDDEQARLAGTVLGGDLVGVDGRAGQPPTSAVIGVYLNDGTAAKMGYYQDLEITGKATTCRPDGSQLVHLDVRLTNNAPSDAATTLPAYVLGPTKFVPWGSVQTNVLFYAPLGGAIETVKLDPGPQGIFAQKHDNLSVAQITTVLSAGHSRTFSVDILTGKGQVSDVQVRSTPLARQSGIATVRSACSA